MSDSTNDFNAFNRQLIAEIRANDGKLGGQFDGSPLLILTTTGAKSGQPRESPLVYTTDGERLVLIASNGGAPNNPDWFHNLSANPAVKVETPGDAFQATASVPDGDERDRLFDQLAAEMPDFAEYQQNTTRRIPVVVLDRVG